MPSKQNRDYPVVALEHFIEATRDSGYKNTNSAIAELIDNSFEAGASKVEISLTRQGVGEGSVRLTLSDDGSGMTPAVLRLALQFGGSTRFNSRAGVGRYGMGLPNSSLSQARRVDVYTWRRPGPAWWCYLDVDEIASGGASSVPPPKRVRASRTGVDSLSASGTVVVWSNCDRLDNRRLKPLTARLHAELGRAFRVQLRKGKSIKINGCAVRPVDPLFLHKGNNLTGAAQYGPPLKYKIRPPDPSGEAGFSTVTVTFSELPVASWQGLSNEEKRLHGISKGAGVSVLRAGREIDYGWHFMGAKRKENYDDWWRCEVQFEPALDELFGVTHTKQGVHPTEELNALLSPDVEKIAHELNGRVRGQFILNKSISNPTQAQSQAEGRDYMIGLPPDGGDAHVALAKYGLRPLSRKAFNPGGIFSGLTYRLESRALKEANFYVPTLSGDELIVLINEEHPFYCRVYGPLLGANDPDNKGFRRALELLLFAASRAECGLPGAKDKTAAGGLRLSWGNVLAAFLS